MIFTVILILATSLLVVAAFSAIEKPRAEVQGFFKPTIRGVSVACAFQEVCRTVLNPQSLSYVAANASRDVLSSFEAEQQRLACFSLQVASRVLIHSLTHSESKFLGGRHSRYLEYSILTAKSAFLLAACAIGRISLGVPHGLRAFAPQRARVRVSARILKNVGQLLNRNTEMTNDLRAWPIRCRTQTGAKNLNSLQEDAIKEILGALSISLPNDFSRLIFLATLRDNNSGHYYHPEAARRLSPQVADAAMLTCHRQIYDRVVALPLEDLTDQLDTYTGIVQVPKERLIENWKKLRAYRATIPVDADPISVEIFFMKVEVAVAILEARLPFRAR